MHHREANYPGCYCFQKIESPQGLSVVLDRWGTAGHLKAPPKDASCLGRDRIETLSGKHRFRRKVTWRRECRMHRNAQGAVVVGRRTIMVRTLLQGGKLGVSMRDLDRAHDADNQNADHGKHLQPDRPVPW
jgi:hypothetical protein